MHARNTQTVKSSFVFSLLASAVLMPCVAAAQATAPAPTTAPAAAVAPAAESSPHTFSTNIGLVSDYRYRGISQSRLAPAISAGADYSHSSGFYVGAWASSIKWIRDGGGKGDLELDLFGGYKFELAKDFNVDVGFLAYVYPSNGLPVNANTQELYVAATYGPVTAKYSISTSNLFGFADSKRSGYFDVTGTFDLGNGWGAIGHAGHQSVRNNAGFGYTDYKLGVTKDIDGWVLGASLIGTDNKNYRYVSATKDKNLGKTGLVLSVAKTF